MSGRLAFLEVFHECRASMIETVEAPVEVVGSTTITSSGTHHHPSFAHVEALTSLAKIHCFPNSMLFEEVSLRPLEGLQPISQVTSYHLLYRKFMKFPIFPHYYIAI